MKSGLQEFMKKTWPEKKIALLREAWPYRDARPESVKDKSCRMRIRYHQMLQELRMEYNKVNKSN